MRSGYSIELNAQQEDAENKAEKLQHTDIYVCNPNQFNELFPTLLRDINTASVSNKRDFQETTDNGEDTQCILFENNAAFCTLALSFNEGGTAALIHEPLAPDLKTIRIPSKLQAQIDKLKNLAKSDGGHMVVSGMNTNESDRQLVQEYLTDGNNERLIPIFAFADDKYHGTNANEIEGLCFIPRGLTNDGRNKIILLSLNSETLHESVTKTPKEFLEKQEE